MGRAWYEEGKLAAKPNTFTDFVACARTLVAGGWTSPDQLVARGGSAGGLLMGAVANLAPELFRAVVAEVPFVDCLTTILDETLPLTVLEWEEWGNPVEDPEIYAVMKSYSPYDNVRSEDTEGRPVRYPDILATGGLSDPRVGFWEPAKWVAKLRAANPDNRVLLKTELGAGHGGPSGRYDAWRDEAFVYAFILDALGLDGDDRRRPDVGAVGRRSSVADPGRRWASSAWPRRGRRWCGGAPAVPAGTWPRTGRGPAGGTPPAPGRRSGSPPGAQLQGDGASGRDDLDRPGLEVPAQSVDPVETVEAATQTVPGGDGDAGRWPWPRGRWPTSRWT